MTGNGFTDARAGVEPRVIGLSIVSRNHQRRTGCARQHAKGEIVQLIFSSYEEDVGAVPAWSVQLFKQEGTFGGLRAQLLKERSFFAVEQLVFLHVKDRKARAEYSWKLLRRLLPLPPHRALVRTRRRHLQRDARSARQKADGTAR